MSKTTERPLVTFVVIAYNQEQFIREAVEGAFAQTYEPLEIILSDDCSPDRTYQIMQEMAASYEGPHKVVLNRNEPNLGINGHVNKIVKLANGDYIVVAAGDDVSVSERTNIILEIFLGHEVLLVHSDVDLNSFGNEVGKAMFSDVPMQKNQSALSLARKTSAYIGATGAWSKELFEKFGDLPSHAPYEDSILGFRAALEGRSFYINSQLVRYRVGYGFSNSPKELKNLKDWVSVKKEGSRRTIALLRARISDLKKSSNSQKELIHEIILNEIEKEVGREIFFSSWGPIKFRGIPIRVRIREAYNFFLFILGRLN